MSIKGFVGRVFMITGVLLLFAALGLVVYNLWDNNRAEEASVKVLQDLKIEEINNSDSSQQPVNGVDDIFAKREMPEKKVDGNKYIGILDLPSIGISLPVMSDWSYPKLKIAPCRYSGSAYKNNLVIAAHNYKSHFGNIGNLSLNDKIYFTDIEGNSFEYDVEEITTLGPHDIEKMKSGECDLTLFTCTLGGATRVTVRCKKTLL